MVSYIFLKEPAQKINQPYQDQQWNQKVEKLKLSSSPSHLPESLPGLFLRGSHLFGEDIYSVHRRYFTTPDCLKNHLNHQPSRYSEILWALPDGLHVTDEQKFIAPCSPNLYIELSNHLQAWVRLQRNPQKEQACGASNTSCSDRWHFDCVIFVPWHQLITLVGRNDIVLEEGRQAPLGNVHYRWCNSRNHHLYSFIRSNSNYFPNQCAKSQFTRTLIFEQVYTWYTREEILVRRLGDSIRNIRPS